MSSSWTAFLPENIAKHPASFVGPNVAGAIVQAFETGILVNQSIRFWSEGYDERLFTKLLVGFVSLVACFQTAIAFYNTWRVIVLGFGNFTNVVYLQWPDRIQPILNCLMSAPFHAFLIWRCWAALHRRWIVLLPLGTLLLATIAMNVIITGDYVTAFVLQAVLDILITTLMFWYLSRVKSQVVSRRLGKIVARLLRMLWEAALPPCICAIIACAVYISMRLENLWDVFFQSILGKLYVISLFVILNGRHDLDKDPPCFSQPPELTRYWASGAMPEVRVHLTTIVDQAEISEIGFTPTTEQSVTHSQLQSGGDTKADGKDDPELGLGRRSATDVNMVNLPSTTDCRRTVIRRSPVSEEQNSP